jgi:hypothetical protein
MLILKFAAAAWGHIVWSLAALVAVMCAILLLLTYKLFFVLILGIGLGTAFFTHRDKRTASEDAPVSATHRAF